MNFRDVHFAECISRAISLILASMIANFVIANWTTADINQTGHMLLQ